MGSLRALGFCIIIVLNLNSCSCLAEYEIFPGFDGREEKEERKTESTTVPSTTAVPLFTRTTTTPMIFKTTTTTTTEDPIFTNSPYKPFVCPEEERPLNIGPYEVPTQKDLVVQMKKTLLRKFRRYHKKALYFLNDISEATRATSMVEKKCPIRNKDTYKMCVRHVSKQCRFITKSLVTSLEKQRNDVDSFTEAAICNVSAMRADPVQLIKTIAMEDASLEFALPGFLRLLGACSVYCHRIETPKHWKKPKRHMSDQDLVIKHFLTRKNYEQLVKGTL